MIAISRRFEWDCAHRVLNHPGKCKHLHGHRFAAEVGVSAPKLNELGFVLDFSVLKKTVGEWIDQCWDHNVLLNSEDPLAMLWTAHRSGSFADKAPYIFHKKNPTAENISSELAGVAIRLLANYPVKIERVRVYESPGCWVDWTPDEQVNVAEVQKMIREVEES